MPTKPDQPRNWARGRYSQAVRIIWLWVSLSENRNCGMTIDDMRSALDPREVSMRMVYRDIEALRSVGVRIDTRRHTEEDKVRYFLVSPIVVNPK